MRPTAWAPEIALHALLPWEREAIVKIAEEWLEIDRSHRKPAHHGSRVEAFYASESTVLQAAGIQVAERPARERRPSSCRSGRILLTGTAADWARPVLVALRAAPSAPLAVRYPAAPVAAPAPAQAVALVAQHIARA